MAFGEGTTAVSGTSSEFYALIKALHQASSAAVTPSLRSAIKGLGEAVHGDPKSIIAAHSAVQQGASSCRSLVSSVAQSLRSAPERIDVREAREWRVKVHQAGERERQLKGELQRLQSDMNASLDESSRLREELRQAEDECALLQTNLTVLKQTRLPSPAPVPVADSADEATTTITTSDAGSEPSAPPARPRRGDWLEGSIEPCRGRDGHDTSSSVGGGGGEVEIEVLRLYENTIQQLKAQLQEVDARALDLHGELRKALRALRTSEADRERLELELSSLRERVEATKSDMAVTQQSVDSQLALLTEHICELSERLSEKDVQLAALQAQRVLCGRCGGWNTVGWLMGDRGGGNGLCHICRGKVLEAPE